MVAASKDVMAVYSAAGGQLATSWQQLQSSLKTKRDQRRACATVNRIMDNRRRYGKPGAIEAEAAKWTPEDKTAARDWAGFFAGLAALFAQIGPMFLK